ncbi:MAG TPA: hypothetical protein P5052_02105 [Candidatus Paceibacterota bacterium]|nr:hypothetical protein [Candidatus Paceibacterota bacterium]HRZ29544.1 hypothetical protein [Candidatus Paceibacterota bacterium]
MKCKNCKTTFEEETAKTTIVQTGCSLYSPVIVCPECGVLLWPKTGNLVENRAGLTAFMEGGELIHKKI